MKHQLGRTVLPPVEFDRPYKGRLTIKTMRDGTAMQAACYALPYKADRLACAHRSFRTPSIAATSCTIYLRDDAEIRRQGWTRQIVLRHEIGHCNGWPGDHKGARP